jgi:hypothetical protein
MADENGTEERYEDVGARIRAVSATVAAPAGLRARIEAQRRPARAPKRRRLTYGLAIAGAAAAAVLVLVLALPSGTPGGPSLAEAAHLGALPATAPAPAIDRRRPVLLDAAQDGVPFPAWAKKFGWTTTGTRHDEVEGRPATTVYYENADGTSHAAYTIVGGKPISPPSDTPSRKLGGTTFHLTTIDGRRVVTWERGGRTCVLSSTTAPNPKLVQLADWRGTGGVPF